MGLTVNTGLTLLKQLKSRLNSLTTLRDKVSTEDRFFSSEKQTTPLYEVKDVDAQITELSKLIFDLECKIKESNAKTKLEGFDSNYGEVLFRPLK